MLARAAVGAVVEEPVLDASADDAGLVGTARAEAGAVAVRRAKSRNPTGVRGIRRWVLRQSRFTSAPSETGEWSRQVRCQGVFGPQFLVV